eukprot:scaffold289114_cov31-Tisochrysis_lutea.AAC.1
MCYYSIGLLLNCAAAAVSAVGIVREGPLSGELHMAHAAAEHATQRLSALRGTEAELEAVRSELHDMLSPAAPGRWLTHVERCAVSVSLLSEEGALLGLVWPHGAREILYATLDGGAYMHEPGAEPVEARLGGASRGANVVHVSRNHACDALDQMATMLRDTGDGTPSGSLARNSRPLPPPARHARADQNHWERSQ